MMSAIALVGVIAGTVLVPQHSAEAAVTEVKSVSVSAVKTSHPKLLVDASGFADMRSRLSTQPTLGSWYRQLKRTADGMLTAPTVRYDKTGGRLLSVSQTLVDRAYTLAFVYQMTGESRYAERLWSDLEAAGTFPDWNPSHFLDTAEMSHAFAIGYDWLQPYWSNERRTKLTTSVKNLGMKPGIEQYNAGSYWVGTQTNWNVISNGGLTLAALSFSAELPAESQTILSKMSTSLPNGLAGYNSDGGYEEGISYWSYATGYLTTLASALVSATGSDQGILSNPGFARTGQFAVRMTGASGRSFNFGDAWPDSPMTLQLLGLAKLYKDASLVERAVSGSRAEDRDEISARAMLWYQPPTETTRAAQDALPLDAEYKDVGVATLRSSWTDELASSAAMRASSSARRSHGNLDNGDFTFDALGVNWATETNPENYDLAGFEDSAAGGSRWDYYVTRPEGQNTLAFGNGAALPTLTSVSAVALKRSDAESGSAIATLNGEHPGLVSSWKRGLSLLDSRQRLLVQDEVTLSKASDAWWFMHTNADVAVSADGRSAVLTQEGKQVIARIVSGDGPTFSYMAATPLPASPWPTGQPVVPRVKKLAIHLPSASNFTLAVELVPVVGTEIPSPSSVTPLSSWPGTLTQSGLQTISVGGESVQGFRPSRSSYSVPVSAGDAVPTITAVPSVSGASVEIKQAGAVPGVATVSVTEAGKAPTVYSIRLHPGAIRPRSVTATASQATTALLSDGRVNGPWAVSGDQSVTFDYGRPVSVKHVEIVWDVVPQLGAKYEILASQDNSTWRTAFTGTSKVAKTAQWSWLWTSPTPYRYLKLSVHGDGAGDRTAKVDEFSAIGPDLVSESPAPVTRHASAAMRTTWSSIEARRSESMLASFARADGASVSPSVTWSSSNPAAATVDSQGRVTGIAAGTARISAAADIDRDHVIASQTIIVTDALKVVSSVVADGFVQGGTSTASSNFGKATNLQILQKTPYPDWEQFAYLGFDLSELADADIESATLSFTANTVSSTATATLTGYAVSGTWSESTLTFANKPALDYPVGTTSITGTPSIRTLDVTDYIRTQTGDSSTTIALRQDDGPGGLGPQIIVKSKESTAPATLDIRLRGAGTTTVTAPSITTATSTAESTGTVTGTLTGPPSTDIVVNLAVNNRLTCAPVPAAATPLPPLTVRTSADGTAAFTTTGSFRVGSWIVATATIGATRSASTDCVPVTQQPGTSTKVVSSVVADGFVQGGTSTASSNFGKATNLQILQKTPYPDWEQFAYLGFDLSELADADIESATLSFTANTVSSTATATLTGYAVSGTWSESTLTFANKPALDYPVGTTSITGTPSIRTLDVTDYIRTQTGDSSTTIALRQDDGPGGLGPQIIVKSKESTAPATLDIRLRGAGTTTVTLEGKR